MKRALHRAGAPAAFVDVGGNLKYDFAPATAAADSPAVRFIEADRGRPLWIAASTSADGYVAEEDFVIAAQRGLHGWRLILAPRQPERFEEVAAHVFISPACTGHAAPVSTTCTPMSCCSIPSAS